MYKGCFKRIIDFIIVFTVLSIIWPILLFITIWLHFANKGAGTFFTQERPGKGGKIFKVIKFKTMTDECDVEGNFLPDADRLTSVGKFIRSTSIDELPQLINVLKVDRGVSVSALPRKYRDIDRGTFRVFTTRISSLQRSTATLKFTTTTRLIRRIMRIDRSLFRRKIDFIGRAVAPCRRAVSVQPIVIRLLIRRCAVGIHRNAS